MVSLRPGLQLPTSSTSRRGGYGCGFDLCSDSIRIDEVKAFKRLSTKGGDLEESTQAIDLIGKDVGDRKSLSAYSRPARSWRRRIAPRRAAGVRASAGPAVPASPLIILGGPRNRSAQPVASCPAVCRVPFVALLGHTSPLLPAQK